MKRRAGGRPSLHPENPDRSGKPVLARRKFPASPAAKTTMPPARPAVNPSARPLPVRACPCSSVRPCPSLRRRHPQPQPPTPQGAPE